MLVRMFRITGSTNPYTTTADDISAIKHALGGCHLNREGYFFTDPRFLQGVFAGILVFYVMLYYTRRYKNRVNDVPRHESFSYVNLPTHGPYREFHGSEMNQIH
ncbi:conserved Plasmodium protein, unknown function [Plasmodium knowlesi strain H]|uniref:Uncharacterized protein n=3 Tax=Plasmodium knowlesi TaxID=5850 RepID=A0A5E7WUM5_PLAKH|nr:conserved Plasmodium protein, unknown function [Plasmodium knowlesi strain H]OTN68619.1 Uncharacterized protein PKNOH_S01009000 [Plasmodium knowlesi]CAA9986093.1 conserved Plasmodium protein, unknown function [Plasmodium knowlesi strain H]SBO25245.1 conserved Plasmodium protein, unknown function [Plasmodium knowlesi strain H]SBO27589.1 conserved Plasmodium protein, unknown function [Plasmodium knowlesi strain H]VVS75567.1 conserved Plasmodium protein, unknown function [Plasmodium knowlesi s